MTHYSETLEKTAIIRGKKYLKYVMYFIYKRIKEADV